MLSDDAEVFHLDHPVAITMEPLVGDAVMVTVSRLDVGARVILFGSTSADGFADAARRGCFHLDDEEPAAGWGDDTPVDLVLRLRSPIAALFSDGDAVFRTLFGEARTPLRATESWLALEATQSVPVPDMLDATAGFGLQTRWAEDDL